MTTSRNAGYAFVGEIAEDLANKIAAIYWSALSPPPVFHLPFSVPLAAGTVNFTATLSIGAPAMTLLPDPSHAIRAKLSVTGNLRAVFQNTVVESKNIQLDATVRVRITVDTSTDYFIPTIDFSTATVESLALTESPNLGIPQAVINALTSDTVRNALQSLLRTQKPLRISTGLVPDYWNKFGVELRVESVAVVPLAGILAVAADVQGYTSGDPSGLVNLFTTPSPQGAQRLLNQMGGDREEPGGQRVPHGGNVAVTVNGDMLLKFLNGPAAEKLKELVWEKDWGGPAALPGPLVSQPVQLQRPALGYQGSSRQLDCLGVDARGTIKALWVLDHGEWQGNVAVSNLACPPGAPIAVGNQQSADQISALVIDVSGTINVLWERATGSWQDPIPLGGAGTFPPGGAIAMVNQGSLDQLTALAIDKNGTMNVLWVRDAGKWTDPVQFGPAGSFVPGGAIAIANQGLLNQLTALTVDAVGTLNLFWVSGSGTWQGPVVLEGSSGMFPPGAPIALGTQDTLGQLTALIVDTLGTVQVAWVTGAENWQGPVPIESTARLAEPGGSIALANQNSLDQLTGVFVDRRGTVQVLWVIGTGDWQGPFPISPSGFTSPLAPVSLANQGSLDQITALVADSNQTLNALWAINSGTWQGPTPLRVQGSLHSSRAGLGYQLSSPLIGPQLDALAVDDSGTLFVLWVVGTDWWQNPIPLSPSNFAPTGAAVAVANQGSLDQLTALIVSNSGAVNALWVISTENWQGPLEISRSGFAPPGAPVAMGNQGPNQLTALVIDAQGTLNVFWVRDKQKWQGPLPIGPAKSFFAGGSIAAANQGSTDQLTALTVDAKGTLQLLWVERTSAWQGPIPISASGFAPPGASIAVANQGSLNEITAVVVDNDGVVNVFWATGSGEWQGPIGLTPAGFAPPGAAVALQYQSSYNQLSAFVIDSTGTLNVLWAIDSGAWKGPIPITTDTGYAVPGAHVAVALQNPNTSDEFLDVFVQNKAGELAEFWLQKYGLTRDGFSVIVSDVSFRFGTFNLPLHPTAWPGLIVEVTAASSGFSGSITVGFDVRLNALGDGDTAWLNRNKAAQNWNFAADYVDISAGWQDYAIALVAGAVLSIVNPGLVSFLSIAFIALFDGIVPSLLANFDEQAQKAINAGLSQSSQYGTAWSYVMNVPLLGTSTTMKVTSYDCAVSTDGLDYFGNVDSFSS